MSRPKTVEPGGDASTQDTPPSTTGVARRPLTRGPVGMTLFLLALPVLGEQLLNTFVGLFDVFLAGRISPTATSAIGLSAYVDWLISMLVMLVGIGTTALVARCVGAGDHDEANHIANQSVTLAAIVGAISLTLVFAAAPAFATYCRMEGEAFTITVHYLRTACLGHMFMSITFVACAALRGVGNMRTPMIVFAIINLVNVLVSSAFVYGLGPIPQLGVSGIVIGTVTARTLGAIIMVAVLLRGQSGIRLIWRQLPIRWARTARILRIGVPAAADGAIMWSGHFIYLAVISRLAEGDLGRALFAAHIIGVRVEAFTYLPATAWATAAATMIGQALGAGKPARAVRSGHAAVLQCGLLSVVVSALFFIFAYEIYALMSDDVQVQDRGAGPFRVVALFQPLLAISIVYVGGLRGAGDTRFPLKITAVGTFLVRLPVGYYFGIVRGGGLMGAWYGMLADMVWRATAASLRFIRGRWLAIRV